MKLVMTIILTSVFKLSVFTEILSTAEFSIIQSWSQEKNYKRQYYVNVPENDKNLKLPIFIALHGNGGNAERMMRNHLRRYPSISKNYIMVFPQGYKASWNIVSERSKANDLAFVESIIKELIKFSNVQKENITILGSSNGAALVNQIAIETKLSNIKNYISLVSPLNSYQHDGKSFKLRGDGNNYKESSKPLAGKRLMNISGTEDPFVPYNGGPSKGIPAKGGKLSFIAAEESIFLWAKLNGYTGKKLNKPSTREGKMDYFEYNNGNIIHIKVNGAGHNAGGSLTEKILLKFLANK